MFKRATGFMDVVAYSGTGSATTQVHNLGVVPEMMIVKSRGTSGTWFVYNKDQPLINVLQLNGNMGSYDDTTAFNGTRHDYSYAVFICRYKQVGT